MSDKVGRLGVTFRSIKLKKKIGLAYLYQCYNLQRASNFVRLYPPAAQAPAVQSINNVHTKVKQLICSALCSFNFVKKYRGIKMWRYHLEVGLKIEREHSSNRKFFPNISSPIHTMETLIISTIGYLYLFT